MTTSIRPAAVAGYFYPDDPAELTDSIQTCLAQAHPPLLPCAPKALLCPHAGYMYSGPVAAAAYASLQPWRTQYTKVILLGPAHRVAVRGLALPECRAFATPLGQVPVDSLSLHRLANLPQVTMHDRAHQHEHSLEVQLPFLQSVLGPFELLPLVVGAASVAEISAVLQLVWDGPGTLIVISSDLSHYHPADEARTQDRATIERILAMDHELQGHEACGAAPLSGFLWLAKRLGLVPHLLDYRHSGDTSGDMERVVGYTAMAFTGAEHAN